jgi:hypothetical protein
MVHSVDTKNQALKLRTLGHSLREIAVILKIARSTASVWVRDVKLTTNAKARLDLLTTQAKSSAGKRWQEYRLSREEEINKLAKQVISVWKNNQDSSRVLASFLFWAEGSKDLGNISFINSDPVMIGTFLKLFRTSFEVDETKFRVLLHLHEYHDHLEMKRYWSNITHIPIKQFSKTFIKSHTKRRIHPDYKGCCKIKYYDSRIARGLSAIYNSLAKVIGP